MAERKVRMWAVWIPGQNRPAYVIATRDGASTCAGHEKFLVRVEVREVKPRKSATTCGQCGKAYSVRACGPTHAMMAVKPRKSGKGKVKRGR